MTQSEFKTLFDNNFDKLRNHLYYRCGDLDIATDIAQDAFIRLWNKHDAIVSQNIVGLLYKISGDMMISAMRHQKIVNNYSTQMRDEIASESPHDLLELSELRLQYDTALASLPEKQRTVFLMSRFDELKYSEIAERLDISVKAVEKRMSAALAYLKSKIKK